MDMHVSQPFAPAQRMPTLGAMQLVRVLRRNLWLVIGCGIVATVGAYAYARTLPKTYTANSILTVEGDRFAIPELQGALRSENAPDPMPWVRTEVQALTARPLVQGVVNELRLSDNPEFNPALRTPSLLDHAKDIVRSWLPSSSSGENAGAGPDEAVLNGVSRALSIFQDNRSLVISVAFTAQDPRLAAAFVNSLVENYVQSRAKRRVDVNQGASTAITERVDQVREDLNALEQRMREMRERGEMIGLRAGSVGQLQLEELTTAAARATLDRGSIEANYQRATELLRQGSSDALASVLGSTTISQLREQEATAGRRLAELSSRYGAGHPSVRSATADLQAVQQRIGQEAQRIVASLGTQLRVARQHEADIQKQLEDARRTGVVAANAQAEMARLQEEVNTRRVLYRTLLERAQQTVPQPVGAETPDVRVLSPAFPPGDPSGPSMRIVTLSGGLSGVLLGCLLALTRTRGLAGNTAAAGGAEAAGLPVLGALRRAALGSGGGALAARVLAKPSGPDAEVMRSLRGRLRFAGGRKVPRTVLFTAAAKGAAGVALAFARVAAMDGEHVLLVEGNLQAPGLSGLLGNPPRGLFQVLDHRTTWHEALVGDEVGQLDLLLAGQGARGDHALLSGVELQNLLVEAQDTYDLVVLEASPASMPATAAVAHCVDVAVLLVDAKAPTEATQGMVGQIAAATRAPLVAVTAS
ncbi:GumC family protein [Roseomonas sp. BN140053]|uniref:GumC family protein n=1 Tax=Roseomonas sp. BN140053 TaxID=3391898 RepID=UPI0039E8F8A3